MKVTLVVDTEDMEGIADTLKIANHFYRKYGRSEHMPGRKVTYGKINLIKMLREYSRLCVEAHEQGEDPHSLRFAKEFAEMQFDRQRDKDLSRL
jgi:hypothetical protein